MSHRGYEYFRLWIYAQKGRTTSGAKPASDWPQLSQVLQRFDAMQQVSRHFRGR